MTPKSTRLLRIFHERHTLAAILPLVLLLTFMGCGDREQSQPTDDPAETQQMTSEMETVTLNATLAGGPGGNPDGSGSASITIDRQTGEVCFEIEVSNIAEPTVAHIHRGAAGESGGVAVNFDVPQHGLSGCVSDVDSDVIDEILESPSNFYVNVHNDPHPGGAVRGQLMSSSQM